MLEFVKYKPCKAAEWDDFVGNSWNGVFLFLRSFMDYHAHRFEDNSLMVYQKNKLVALLPANRKDDVLHSHQGLTYGGWIMKPRFSVASLEAIISETEQHLVEQGIREIYYKHKPFTFAKHFNDSDTWVLWKNGYELWRRDLSFVIDMKNSAGFARDKRYRYNKSQRNGLEVHENIDVERFMELVRENLKEKYQTNPVHTTAEVFLLQKRFPSHIKTYTVFQNSAFLGGAWVFADNDFVHTQYLHFNDAGRKLCAVEFLVDHLLQHFGSEKRYLSFGTSTEEDGHLLNTGLATFKEGFGAAGVCHDFYRKTIWR